MYNPAFPTTTESGAPYSQFAPENMRSVCRSVINANTMKKQEEEVEYESAILGTLTSESRYSLIAGIVAKKFSLYKEVLVGSINGLKAIQVEGKTYIEKRGKVVQFVQK